jgi:uncharacterized protein (TIGR02391 family)
MKSINKITANKRQELTSLAGLLGELIPATSRGSFSFEAIANSKKSSKKFWVGGKNKMEMIGNFLINTYRYHPNLVYKVIRENIHRGISRRHEQGNPVLEAEIQKLDELLKVVGINMTSELKKLNLPKTRPCIVPPPIEYQNMLKKVPLETDINEKCKQLFIDGHINESVRKAFEIFEARVQKSSGLEDTGKDLMMKVFNENSPVIKIAEISTQRGKSIQEGYRFLAAGSMLFLRNKFSHGDEEQESYIDGFQMLLTANLLLRELNKATI